MRNFYFFGMAVAFIAMAFAIIYGVAAPKMVAYCMAFAGVCIVAIYGAAYQAMDGDSEEKGKMAELVTEIATCSAVIFFFAAVTVKQMVAA